MQALDGAKTYIVAAATVLFALTGWFIGQVDGGVAAEMVLNAIMAATIRHGVKTGA